MAVGGWRFEAKKRKDNSPPRRRKRREGKTERQLKIQEWIRIVEKILDRINRIISSGLRPKGQSPQAKKNPKNPVDPVKK